MRLTYYLDGINTADADVFRSRHLLSRDDGTGRCGAWGRFFLDMCAIHGVGTNQGIAILGVQPVVHPIELVVEIVTFHGAGQVVAIDRAPFTHGAAQTGADGTCEKGNGVPGQGKTNPQFVFANHCLVRYGGRIYDPSYGTASQPSLKAWEDLSIGGLAVGNDVNFTMRDGTAQALPARCSRGYIPHRVTDADVLTGDVIDALATRYGIANDTLWTQLYTARIRANRVSA